MYMMNASVQMLDNLSFPFFQLAPSWVLWARYAFVAGRYCWRGITIGLLRERAKASTACWDVESVRMVLPMDMKNLETAR